MAKYLIYCNIGYTVFNQGIIFVEIPIMSIESLSAAYKTTYRLSPYKMLQKNLKQFTQTRF